MYKIFVEYKIHLDMKEQYFQLTKKMMLQYPQVEFYEAADQPNLYVEVWHDCNEQFYDDIKQQRLQGGDSATSLWSELEECVVDGKEKIHIWAFKPLH